MKYRGFERERIARGAIVLLLLGLAFLLVDCDFIVPRQSWSTDQWGAIVPHTKFPADCGLCHRDDRWDILAEDFEWDHEAETGFALVGAHKSAACLRCHNDRGPVQVYLARGCGGCHVDIHKGALGMQCHECHGEVSWTPKGLIADHAMTRFPLVGIHALAPCESCHDRATVGDYRGAPAECHGCHQMEARQAFPNHIINGWNVNCDRCHTPANVWKADGASHAQFPLQGGHAGLDCTQCHVNGLFAPINPNCFQCHQQDYINAPNHLANNLSTDCTLCHDINLWK